VTRRIIRAAFCLLVVGGAAGTALAHNQPPPIESWGPFLPGTQTCLRTISRATHACFDRVFALEQDCRDAELQGRACDRDGLDAEIAAADGALRATLSASCADGQLTELGYIGLFDAGADLNRGCVGEARSAITALYAPARDAQLSPAAAQCLSAVASYGRKMMWFALQREVPVMERIATRLVPEADKQASILRVNQELSADRARWSAGLLAACPTFEQVYGRTPDSLLRTLKQRVDCVLSRTYVHSAIACLPQVCGNGIPEGTEACDDGNTVDDDACSNACLPAR
jgi:cysteine-rich repeat protein